MLIKQFQEKKTKLELELQPSAKLDKISETSPSVPSKKEKPVKKEESSTSFYIKEKFRCSPGDLFECLVNPARVKAYAGGDAIVSREKGGTFKLFGGSVEGENLEVVKGSQGLTAQMPPHKLVQKWRFASWPEGHFSRVEITLAEKDSDTEVTLCHEGVACCRHGKNGKGLALQLWTRIKGMVLHYQEMYLLPQELNSLLSFL